MKARILVHSEYPAEINHPDGLIIAAMLREVSFPAVPGIGVQPHCEALSLDLMAQKWTVPDYTKEQNNMWGWFYPTKEVKDFLDDVMLEGHFEYDRWYFIDWWDETETN